MSNLQANRTLSGSFAEVWAVFYTHLTLPTT